MRMLSETKKLTNFSVKWISQRSSFSKYNKVNSCWPMLLTEIGDVYQSIVCIDHFSKWRQANPIKNKISLAVAQSLYKLIFRCECIEIQINNKLSICKLGIKKAAYTKGVEQRITSTYHLQSNKLVERQNCSIKRH